MKQKILFLDRDGTLIAEPPEDYQVDSLAKLSFLPGVFRNLIQIVKECDFQLVMITNQDGLGTDIFPEETFWPPHELMMKTFEGEGIHFEKVFIDRTFKKDGAPTRKPGTALLTEYFSEEYDLENSWVVGDRPSDIQLAKNLGAKGILLGRSVDNQDDEWDLETLPLGLVTESWDEIGSFLLAQKSPTRTASISRVTNETDIQIRVDLDGKGEGDHRTGIGFFDHMLDQLAKHSGVNLEIKVAGDLHIDAHHTIEDTGLALGKAFADALGDKRGILRYGHSLLPMDEALAQVALDFSGRSYLVFNGDLLRDRVGGMPCEMVEHFFKSFCDTAKCTLNIRFEGENAHHMIEAIFKGVAKAIKMAISYNAQDRSLPSTKGVL